MLLDGYVQKKKLKKMHYKTTVTKEKYAMKLPLLKESMSYYFKALVFVLKIIYIVNYFLFLLSFLKGIVSVSPMSRP